MKPDLEYLKERFARLRRLYLETVNRTTECESPDERRYLVQEMHAITDEAQSIALEYRVTLRNRSEAH
jgi:hypothetical protein